MITPYSNTISVTTLEELLLDTYSGAAAAYSLRKLSATYTGDAIGVRIDTTGQPEYNIGFVNNELDVATLEGYCTGGLNAYVTTWYDQSGNARDATQSTAAQQPQIVSSGSVINLNSKPTLQFNNNQILTRASFNLSQISIFTVINKYTMNNYGGYLRNVTSSGVSFAVVSKDSNAWFSQCVRFLNGADQSPYVARSTSKTLPTGQYLENWIFNNSIQQFYENNSSVTTNTGASNWPGVLSFAMGSTSYDGIGANSKNEIQEMIIYDADQSTNRTGISTNINSIYGIY